MNSYQSYHTNTSFQSSSSSSCREEDIKVRSSNCIRGSRSSSSNSNNDMSSSDVQLSTRRVHSTIGRTWSTQSLLKWMIFITTIVVVFLVIGNNNSYQTTYSSSSSSKMSHENHDQPTTTSAQQQQERMTTFHSWLQSIQQAVMTSHGEKYYNSDKKNEHVYPHEDILNMDDETTMSNQIKPPFLGSSSSSKLHSTSLPMPAGVNFGSWLSLEDYFYVGNDGATEVATPDNNTAAICLPPLHTGEYGPKWQSETDLFMNLCHQIGIKKALMVFHAHRTSYIDYDTDLPLLYHLGIQSIRVPISWCLTDYDPSTIDIKTTNNTNRDSGGSGSRDSSGNRNSTSNSSDDTDLLLYQQYTCQDPFYPDIYWPAVPKSILISLLESCSKYNVSVVFDIHTYPGATSIGTFSGLWPKWSKFWTDGDRPEEYTKHHTLDVGRTIYSNFVHWIEQLAIDHPVAFHGLRGISSMNEPAHLAGLFGPGAIAHPDRVSFLPNLPNDIAQSYLQKLNQETIVGEDEKTKRKMFPHHRKNHTTNFTIIPDGPHLRVFLWLSDSVQIFRESKLPSLGKQLHINIHESIFHPTILPKNESTNHTYENAAIQLIGSWWRTTTSYQERTSWCILDVHHYHAWDDNCQGASDGISFGNYTCSDTIQREQTLNKCAAWVHDTYRTTIDEQCGDGTKLISAEFSSSTHHFVKHACNDVTTLRSTYTKQLLMALKSNVELFYWSYKMPYGGAFRSAWSFTHLMYRFGILSQPDEPIYNCQTKNHNHEQPDQPPPIDPIFDNP
jgi:hypothetical protein